MAQKESPKIKTAQTSKAKVLFVYVPNLRGKTFDLDFGYLEYPNIIDGYDDWEWDSIKLPQGNWKIINTLDSITDSEAKDVLGFSENKSIPVSEGRNNSKVVVLYEPKI